MAIYLNLSVFCLLSFSLYLYFKFLWKKLTYFFILIIDALTLFLLSTINHSYLVLEKYISIIEKYRGMFSVHRITFTYPELITN